MAGHAVHLSQERAAKPPAFLLIVEANGSFWEAVHVKPELAGVRAGGVLQTRHLPVAWMI